MTHAKAAAPSRGTYQVLSWGLVSIPVSVFTGLDKGASVPRRQFTTDGHPVGSQSYDKETGLPVTTDGIVKMAEASDGTLVPLTDEEVEAATSGAVKGVAEILAFVPLAALGREYVITGSDQVRPAQRRVGAKKMTDPVATQAFTLLLAAMADQEVAALVKVAGRSGSRYVAVTPDGRWLTLAYADDVRAEAEMPAPEVSGTLLAQGLALIGQVGVSTPVLEDSDGAAIQAYVDAKSAGMVPEAPAEPATLPVSDLMTVLEASLVRAKAA